ncbi:hypothetical protein ACTWPT_12580 [Nonomuraea sp. 3N208]|uniref:hypothetical protein n=1 Tax=Nonomuraea sp. 3N208 TaxID=3457421 RepID=UPI003FCE988A
MPGEKARRHRPGGGAHDQELGNNDIGNDEQLVLYRNAAFARRALAGLKAALADFDREERVARAMARKVCELPSVC